MDKENQISELIIKVDCLAQRLEQAERRIEELESVNTALRLENTKLSMENTELKLENTELKAHINSNSNNSIANHHQVMAIKKSLHFPKQKTANKEARKGIKDVHYNKLKNRTK